jgi:REP element-mobilizing transposase RayT
MKYHPHGSVLFATFSIEQGILLLCNPLCEAIIKSCLARAQFMYPVRVVAFLIEGTHIHLVLVVDNPDDVPAFIRHFKTESAHALNRILGRRKRTIWCEGYDSPVVLTPLRTLMVLTYIYSNPAKDDLEKSIDRYPGVSSWKMFTKGEHKKSWKRIRRPAYKALTPDVHNLSGYTREAQRLLADSKKSHTFVLDPNAWLVAFGITSKEDQDRYNQRLIERVRTVEEREQKKRERLGKKVMGAEKLRNQCFDTTRLSSRAGKRMWCMSENRDLRIRFIEFLKSLFAEARSIRERWKVGDYSLPYPLGLYPPSMPKLAEPLTIW